MQEIGRKNPILANRTAPVSSKEGFSAVIRHGKTLIEISGDDFAVRQTD